MTPPELRRQTACNLGVRYTWEVAPGHSHPAETFTCAEDPAMAANSAVWSSLALPPGLRLVGVAISATGGRDGSWEPLETARAGDRTMLKRGKWIFLHDEPAGWYLVTYVASVVTAAGAVVRVTVNGRGPAYQVEFAPDAPVALRYSHPDE